MWRDRCEANADPSLIRDDKKAAFAKVEKTKALFSALISSVPTDCRSGTASRGAAPVMEQPARRHVHATPDKIACAMLARQLRSAPAVESKRLLGPRQGGHHGSREDFLELLAEFEESWEDAARQAVAEAAKTVRGIRSVYMSEFQATVENDQVKNYRANVKISFVIN